jgi:hypothetical protein
MSKENRLIKNKHILVCIDDQIPKPLDKQMLDELDYIKNNFCGIVLNDSKNIYKNDVEMDTLIYLCGNIEQLIQKIKNQIIYVIREFSENYDINSTKYEIIGQVSAKFQLIFIMLEFFSDKFLMMKKTIMI